MKRQRSIRMHQKCHCILLSLAKARNLSIASLNFPLVFLFIVHSSTVLYDSRYKCIQVLSMCMSVCQNKCTACQKRVWVYAEQEVVNMFIVKVYRTTNSNVSKGKSISNYFDATKSSKPRDSKPCSLPNSISKQTTLASLSRS